jgi:hypothetical protein
MPSLDDFDGAVLRFDLVAKQLRPELGRHPGLSGLGGAIENAADVVAFSSVLRDVSAATMTAIDGWDVTAPAPGPWPALDVRRLMAAFKAWFYFARIYQDMLYRVLARSVRGMESGGGSMKNALRENNPVRAVLDEDANGYLEWFRLFRDRRNILKEGVVQGLVGAEEVGGSVDYGIQFVDKAGKLHIVRLRDVTVALDWSMQVTTLAMKRMGELGGADASNEAS